MNLAGRHVYLDANVLIACVERPGRAGGLLEQWLRDLASGDMLASTSELTLAEVLTRPLLRKERGLVARYEELLAPGAPIRSAPVVRAILRRAALLCAEGRMDLPDAIHVATASECGCDLFLSNDREIRLPAQIELRRLDLL